jgi:hypothetical protein
MEKRNCTSRLVAEDAYVPLADVPVPCSVRQIREEAVELLTSEERAAERQLIYTLAQEKAVGCTAFTYLLAKSDVEVLRSTALEGYQLLWEYRLQRGSAGRRVLAARAGAACRALLRANFALQPARRGRTRVVASTVQARLLLAYLPLEPLRSTALHRSEAEAVVDFAIGLRQVAVSAYLRGGTLADALRALADYVRSAPRELEDVIQMAPVADHLYDEAAYTRYYLRRFGLL